ncbi:hypothetical protein [Bacillus thuringiensis]|uniref:hypothetical protein n=1 Tax=Bacillus thuringiensis TaxID=1428 RepID=UPI000CD9C7C1|nr:hypothetical protein [Bacillus thuringiensis]
MPYIDSTPALSPYKVREGNLQHGFMDLLIKHGWTKVVEFKKAVTGSYYVTDHPLEGRHDEKFTVANHIILRNARGDLFGFAVVADWKEFTAHDKGIPYYNAFKSTATEKEALINYMAKEFEKRKVNTSLYFYMLEKLPDVKEGDKLFTPWGTGSSADEKRLQMALDIEVTQIDFKSTSAGSEFVKQANPVVMQSPIVESSLRSPLLENIDYPYMHTNWWIDSEINIKGHIDSNSLFLIIQTDNTPMWENNVVPIVPIYFGDIEAIDEGDPAIALFAGTVPKGTDTNGVAAYNFDDIKIKGGRQIMPVLKKYPSNPSNGVDSVMVSRTKLGSRYQSYYLSWNAPAQDMPPKRVSEVGNKQYPRAWERINNYQFNPSRYSDKVQTSFIYLIHPEEGVRGYLKKSVGFNSINMGSSELRIRQESCPEKVFDVYQCVPVSAISPLTKRPSTQFRPMGLGLYKEALNTSKKPVANKTLVNVSNLKATNPQEGTVLLTWTNPNDMELSTVNIFVNGMKYATGVTEVESYTIKNVTKGNGVKIKLVSVDMKGNESAGIEVSVNVM